MNRRVVWYVLLFVLGVLVAAAGSLVQNAWFPGGLLLALLGVAGVFYGGLRATETQLGVLVPGASWLLTIVLLGLGRPEGDGVFADGPSVMIYLLGGMTLAVMCATMVRLPRPTP
ncbi:DUF6113 family protein [Streptomyces sp. NPDC003027]